MGLHKDQRDKAVQAAPWLLLGLCAGVGGLLYLNRCKSKIGKPNADLDLDAKSTNTTPEPGDILLFHNAKGLNKLITGFTHSPFYHAGLYAGDGNTVEARTPGVLRQDLQGREADYVVVPAPEGRGKAALAWAETQVGDSYDVTDILVIVLDRICRFVQINYTPRGKYSCGEFVAVAFHKAGAHLFPKHKLADVVPGDFARFLPPGELKGPP